MPETLSKAADLGGCMIALCPDPKRADALAVPGGEPADRLHLTLAYLGDARSVDKGKVLRATKQWAGETPPLTGKVGGTARFTAGDEPANVLVADVPHLHEHVAGLTKRLGEAGLEVPAEHGFNPHITVGYGEKGKNAKADHGPLHFSRVSVVHGGDRTDFKLAGVRKAFDPSKHPRTPDGEFAEIAGLLQQHFGLEHPLVQSDVHHDDSVLGRYQGLADGKHRVATAGLPRTGRIAALAHEAVHAKQRERMGGFEFGATYRRLHRELGYHNHPMEVEARKGSEDFMRNLESELVRRGLVRKAGWDETKHPRGVAGRFIEVAASDIKVGDQLVGAFDAKDQEVTHVAHVGGDVQLAVGPKGRRKRPIFHASHRLRIRPRVQKAEEKAFEPRLHPRDAAGRFKVIVGGRTDTQPGVPMGEAAKQIAHAYKRGETRIEVHRFNRGDRGARRPADAADTKKIADMAAKMISGGSGPDPKQKELADLI